MPVHIDSSFCTHSTHSTRGTVQITSAQAPLACSFGDGVAVQAQNDAAGGLTTHTHIEKDLPRNVIGTP